MKGATRIIDLRRWPPRAAASVALLLVLSLWPVWQRASAPPPPPPRPPVVVDPGHGGIDSGAHYASVMEKDINLDVALKLAAALEGRGIPAVLTRDRDVELSLASYREDLQKRIDIARAHNAWALIAIHANATDNPGADGTLVLFQEKSEKGRRLARAIRQALATAQPGKPNLADVERDHYYFDNSPVPTLAVEVGYLTNPGDRANLLKEGFRARLAEAIASGIAAVWAEEFGAPPGSGTAPGGGAASHSHP